MKFLIDVSLQNILRFYVEAKHEVGVDSSFSVALKGRGGLRCKRLLLGNELRNLELLPKHIQSFFKAHGEIYFLPVEDMAGIRAFFTRACLAKDFRVMTDGKPYFYGLHRFKDFIYGKLVILAEGIKDAEAIARFYPFSLAVLGNHVSFQQADILKRLTDKYVFVGDSDEWGKRHERLNLNAGCKSVYFVPGAKDPGEYFERDGIDLESFVNGIKLIHGGRNE